MVRIIRLVAVLSACFLLAGCAGLGVEPWDRDLLARPDMEMINDPLEAGLDAHIYFRKEASSGGEGFAGGGCGCN